MRKLRFSLVICSLMLLASCQKNGLRLFEGDYSYKTSGTVQMTEIASDSSLNAPLSFKVNLQNEIGQMQVISLDKGADSVMVIMNTMGGDVIVAHAKVDKDKIMFHDFNREINLLDINLNLDLNCEVTVTAEGTMYDDDSMIINMVYSGEHSYLNKVFSLESSVIIMYAQRN